MFSLASVATMAACIFVFGLFFSIIMNFQYIVHKAEEGVAITVFFNDDATQEQIDNIGAQLKKQDGVKEIKYVSADEAWDTFKDQYFGESSDLAEGFKNDNPLAGSDNYEVYMTDVASQKKLVSFAESLDGVRKVNKSDTVANTLNSVNKLVWYVSVVIIAILLAVSIFLISNTVTMGITVRREEIAIMKYIGAKDGFVRAPFIIEGILIGLVGAAIPLGILYVLYNRAITYILTKFSLLNNILDFLPVGQVYKTLLPVGLLLGIGIGFVMSLVIVSLSGLIISFYHLSDATAAITRQLLNSVAVINIFQSANSILTKGVLRGDGDTKALMVMDSMFLWILAIPLGSIAGLVLGLPAFWVYFFLKCDDIFKCIWCVWRLNSGKWIKKI